MNPRQNWRLCNLYTDLQGQSVEMSITKDTAIWFANYLYRKLPKTRKWLNKVFFRELNYETGKDSVHKPGELIGQQFDPNEVDVFIREERTNDEAKDFLSDLYLKRNVTLGEKMAFLMAVESNDPELKELAVKML